MLPMWSAPVARSVDVAFVVVLLIIAVVAGIVVFLLMRNRSAHSSVDSFRRQIDALGPEARRTVVDQVQNAASRSTSEDDAATEQPEAPPTAAEPTSPSPDDETPDDEGGARGT